MKTILYTLLFLLSINFHAQSFIEKYEDIDDVSSVLVTEEMFKMLGSIEPEGQKAKEELEVLKDLTGLRILSTDKSEYKTQILNDVNKYISTHNLKELIRIKDKDAKVIFYVIKGGKPFIANELVMIMIKKEQPEEVVVMQLTGKINLKKISKLNSKVNMIDKKYFEEVEQKMNNK